MALGSGFNTLADSLLGAFGSSASVTLRGGETGTIVAAVGKRTPKDLTGGIHQIDKTLIVKKSDWDAVFSRPPNKGDVFTILGGKYAVVSTDIKGASGTEVAYKCTVKG